MTFKKSKPDKRQWRDQSGADRGEGDQADPARITNIATGPMIGKKFKVAASAPSPAGFGIPVTAQIMPVAAPTRD